MLIKMLSKAAIKICCGKSVWNCLINEVKIKIFSIQWSKQVVMCNL